MSLTRSTLILGGVAVLVAACSGDKPPARPPSLGAAPQPTAETTTQPAPAPKGEGGGAAAQGGAQGSEAQGGAAAKPDVKPEPPKSSGRPAAIYGPSQKISSTFGATPGSKLKLKGGVALLVPEFALPGGINIVFEMASGATSTGPAIGGIAQLATQWAGKQRFESIPSKGPAFEVVWPLASRDTLNLAVGWLELDAQGQPTKKVTKWDIHAPKRVDKGLGEAYFEIDTIGPAFLHGTTKAPTVTAAPAP